MADVDEDLQLLERWRDGDKKAGTQLFERYFPLLYRFFRNKVADGAEDLVQETFLSCLRNADRFRGDSSFRSYVFRAAQSRLFDHYRGRNKRDAVDFGVTSVVDLGESPSRMLVRDEDEGLLLAALRRLPLELQIVLELFYVEKLRGPVLAEILEIPEGTARSRLRRARERLRTELEAVTADPAAAEQSLANLDAWAARLREGGLAPPR